MWLDLDSDCISALVYCFFDYVTESYKDGKI